MGPTSSLGIIAGDCIPDDDSPTTIPSDISMGIVFPSDMSLGKAPKSSIGKGGYSVVYKGELSIAGRQTTVAMKRLNETLDQGLKEFLTEIQLSIS
ncbi:serine-threonine/tyrosine-protein kinase catalytic domain-containing protein [Tanacetum coccineum]